MTVKVSPSVQAEFPDWQARVERLSEYIASTGKSYKNHLATIRTWARKDTEQVQQPEMPRRKTFSEIVAEAEANGTL